MLKNSLIFHYIICHFSPQNIKTFLKLHDFYPTVFGLKNKYISLLLIVSVLFTSTNDITTWGFNNFAECKSLNFSNVLRHQITPCFITLTQQQKSLYLNFSKVNTTGRVFSRTKIYFWDKVILFASQDFQFGVELFEYYNKFLKRQTFLIKRDTD